ncbi:1-acylglycerol-3-phosphate O-acyltransferase [Ferrimonas marina]|uniref:1-acyl-sn-glycerol-3-phosphate acyltransferase n=1 Tax=Ferrimonas marina TaxID=299255 RepID=A0A1M5X5X0_9GAMM|nr:1-acylglycerol-3-phosphate O-acyltransferase [Ferrimonas marina]SHH95042.1 1-acyl-sn-glycerol-3-phosphate acyltransferase [Ferrimonas marina]
MLKLLRSLMLGVLLIGAFVLALLMCLLRPFHRNNVYQVANWFGKVGPLLGLKVVKRGQENLMKEQAVVYIGNHQNSYDLFTQSSLVPPGTVSLGKKSLIWIPLFGQIYWLTGNILIDRGNRSKAISTIQDAARKIREKALSVWIFPEGTRSRGRGLLPFKTGAFHTAISAGVPIVPVLASCQKDICMNKKDNGVVIVEAMEPIPTEGLSKEDVRALAQKVYDMMNRRLAELNAEAAQLAAAK